MTEKPKSQPKRKNPKPDNPEQSNRFIEAARQIEADESGEAFRRAFEKIVRREPKPEGPVAQNPKRPKRIMAQ
jgi:hypothetical protein